jgi:hypothetical protein
LKSQEVAVSPKNITLYASWRHVYEAVETLRRDAGDPTANGHWRLDCSCPCCANHVALGLTVAFNRRGHVVSHGLQPAETLCPTCGERLSERDWLYSGVQPEPAEEPGVDTWENEGGAVLPDGDKEGARKLCTLSRPLAW